MFYESMMQQQEDYPLDPNHQNVISISSDDDEYGDGGLEDLDDTGSQGERSSYFQPPPEVDAFNARCRLPSPKALCDFNSEDLVSQIQQTAPMQPPRPQGKSRNFKDRGSDSSKSFSYRKGGKRSSGSSNRTSGSGGMTSKRSSKSSSAKATSKQGGSGGGVSMMPT